MLLVWALIEATEMFNLFKNTDEETDEVMPEFRLSSITSQLPRLVRMRIDNAKECACERCGDLLDNLHMKTKLLEQHHQAELPALSFWTHSHKDGGSPHFEMQLDNKLKLTPSELTRHDEFIDTLLEVEHNWQRSQRNTCSNDDTDRFWMNHYLQLKNMIAEQRERDEESLDDLRSAVLQISESES